MCYYKPHLLRDNSKLTKSILNKGKKVNKVLNDAKPILEATLVSIILVGTALGVPAAIIYTAI